MPTFDPRTAFKSRLLSVVSSTPSSTTLPFVICAAGGSSLIRLIIVTLLPQPLSPTTPSISPLSRLNETPFTA